MHERTVLFLHGVLGGPEDFGPLEALLDDDARCVAPELPFGSRPSFTMETLFACVDDALEDEGLTEAVLVGHSFGSALALAYAGRRPERVRGLVLSGLLALDVTSIAGPPAGIPLLLLSGAGPPDDSFARAAARRLRGARLLFIGDGADAPLLLRPTLVAFHIRAFLNDVYPRVPFEDEPERAAVAR